MAMACFHPVVKVQSASIHFFLGSEQDDGEMEVSDDEATLLFYSRMLSHNGSVAGSRYQDITTPSRNKQENSFRRQEVKKTNKKNEKGFRSSVTPSILTKRRFIDSCRKADFTDAKLPCITTLT